MRTLLFVLALLALPHAVAEDAYAQRSTPAAPKIAQEKAKDPLDLKDMLSQEKTSKDEPTYINSNSLTLNNEQRTFEYAGNVQVKRGEMTLTADFLDGTYDQNNQIKQLTAKKHVLITKGDTMRATCDRAVYDAPTRVFSLYDNPQLEQNGSSLSADVIKVFMDENRSVAEGQVRVKVVQKEIKKAGTDAVK